MAGAMSPRTPRFPRVDASGHQRHPLLNAFYLKQSAREIERERRRQRQAAEARAKR